MCCEGAIAHNIIHFEKNQCIQPPDNTAVTKHFMFFTRRQPHVSSLMSHNYAVVVLKLLMLSGDVETNPGPPGITYCPQQLHVARISGIRSSFKR